MPTLNLVTYCEALPATKSSPHNAIKWTPNVDGHFSPVVGALLIESKRSTDLYFVIEFPCNWGRGFTLAKKTRGTDHTEASYNLCVSPHGEAHDSCDCKGSTATGGCKHRAALRALISNGWL
jgi:hypothetical protein